MSEDNEVIIDNLTRLRAMAENDLNTTAKEIFNQLSDPKTDKELRSILLKFYTLGNIQDGLKALRVNIGKPPEIEKTPK